MASIPPSLAFPFFSFLILLLSGYCGCVFALDSGEIAALQDMQDEWGSQLQWTGEPSCNWPGVSCNSAGSVNKLILMFKGLTGTIPESVGNLLALLQLYVSLSISFLRVVWLINFFFYTAIWKAINWLGRFQKALESWFNSINCMFHLLTSLETMPDPGMSVNCGFIAICKVINCQEPSQIPLIIWRNSTNCMSHLFSKMFTRT